MGRVMDTPLLSSIEYGHIYSPGQLFHVDVVPPFHFNEVAEQHKPNMN